MEIKQASGNDIKRVFGLVAGRAGVGKTTQLTTFPIDRTMGISIEDGFLSIEGSGYKYAEAKTYEELLGFVTNIKKIAPWVEYLYIDSLTEIYDMLKRTLGQKYSAKQNFAKHEDMYDMLIHLVRVARQLDISVFFTCHTKDDKNGLILEEELAFDGKMPENVKKQFDLVVHLKDVQFDGKQEKTKCFITDPQISKVSKKRVSPWLGTKIGSYEEPNLYKLTQKLLGKGA